MAKLTSQYILYHNRLKQGLCPHCGGSRGPENWIKCDKCRAQNKTATPQQRKRRNKNKRILRSYRRNNHFCTVCGDILNDGYRQCDRCRERFRKYRARINSG